MIKKDNNFSIVDKQRFVEEYARIKNDKATLDAIRNGIKEINFQPIFAGIVDNNELSIVYLKSRLVNEKCLTLLTKAIYKSFSNNPFIYELEKDKYSYFIVNSSYLKNEYLDKIVLKSENKKSFFVVKVDKSNFKEELSYNNLNKNNLIDMFNDICYKFVYLYILNINKPFKLYLKYETLFKYAELNNIDKQLNKLNNECKKSNNPSKQMELNKMIMNLSNQKEAIQKQFNYEYDEIV